MKELPILFSTPMVQAIQENRKAMTRRLSGLEKVNEFPDERELMKLLTSISGEFVFAPIEADDTITNKIVFCKPRYQVGDHLWVKETFVKVEFENGSSAKLYKADCAYPDQVKWKPSLFMRKEYARLWLEVTGVRCERLKDITNEDAFAEGIEWKIKYPEESPDHKYYRDYMFNDRFAAGEGFQAKNSFFTLWRKINGMESLQSNPWVFIYEFKPIEKQ